MNVKRCFKIKAHEVRTKPKGPFMETGWMDKEDEWNNGEGLIVRWDIKFMSLRSL